MIAAGTIKIHKKGPVFLLAIAGFLVCIIISTILFTLLIAPGRVCPVPAAASPPGPVGKLTETAVPQTSLLQRLFYQPPPAGGRRAGKERHGVQGAAERDALERPSVPGWDPVLRLPPADLADMDPDQLVDRALGEGPAIDASIPVAAPPAAPVTSIPVAAPPAAAAAEAATDKNAASAKSTDADHAPIHQVLPPPANAHPAPVFAVQMAFFLDPHAASDYSATLARDGVATRLVEQLDEAGRTWVYVRSPAFTDSVAALAYAETLERKLGVSAVLVREPPPAAVPTPDK